MRSVLVRSRIWLLSAVSGGMFVLSGCDPNVRDTVLAGVETASTTLITTFIQAFFQTVLAPNDEGAATVVKAVVEHAPSLFA